MSQRERERTKEVRCLARALRERWEADATPFNANPQPADFLVDYYRRELAVGDDAVAYVSDKKIYVANDNWVKHLPNVSSDAVIDVAKFYIEKQ